MMTAFEQQRAALDPTALHLLDHKGVESAMAPQQWLQVLTPLAVLDEQADAEVRRLKGKATGYWVIGGAALFFGLILLIVSPLIGGPVLVASVVLFVLASRTGAHKRKAESFSVPDSLRETVLPLVLALNEDAGRHSTLRLTLDLRPVLHADAIVRQNVINLAGWRKCTETINARRWLHGDMLLADGTHVAFITDDVIRTRSGTKRGSSGKIKHKTKRVRWVVVSAVSKLPTDHYRLLPAPRHRTQYRLKVKQGPKRTTIVAKQKIKTADLNRITPATMILSAISEGHRCVEPVRSAAA